MHATHRSDPAISPTRLIQLSQAFDDAARALDDAILRFGFASSEVALAHTRLHDARVVLDRERGMV